MQIIGKAVKHGSFGQGIVTAQAENKITVCFSQGEKNFLYPDAFSKFLFLKDEALQKELSALCDQQIKKQKERQKQLFSHQERMQRLRSLKINENSQTVFNLTEAQLEEAFSVKEVFCGKFLSGYSKGRPRTAVRVQPNSACLLTYCPRGKEEKERIIAGVFMTAEDFVGKECDTGIIPAHEKYFLRLLPQEQLLFWDYFEKNSSIKSWGSIPFQYFSNQTMRQILLDMKAAAKTQPQEEQIAAFYHYFCKVNQLRDSQSEDADA